MYAHGAFLTQEDRGKMFLEYDAMPVSSSGKKYPGTISLVAGKWRISAKTFKEMLRRRSKKLREEASERY